MGVGFEQGSVFHRQGDLVDWRHLAACADLLMTTSPNVLLYAAIDGWRRQMVRDGDRLLGDALDLARGLRRRIQQIAGLTVMESELCGAQASHDLDLLQVLLDVTGLGLSGYHCADWLRAQRNIDIGLADHRRILATISIADDAATADRLVDALTDLSHAAATIPVPQPIRLPTPTELELDTVLQPREAFFGRAEMVSADDAPGRVAAEQLTPYPPGIPVVVPGERLTTPIVDYLRSGLAAGMGIPDATDPTLTTFRVSAEPGT
jgi:arginine/lysine/ornithine decarboxylase